MSDEYTLLKTLSRVYFLMIMFSVNRQADTLTKQWLSKRLEAVND